MTLKNLYEAVGGDYKDVVKRLISEEFAAQLALGFLDDDGFSSLEKAMKNRNAEDAFRAAHTLKGVALNLGFKNLGESASELTEVLRKRTFDGADEPFEKVRADYAVVISALRSYVSARG